jgi:hypothetical protein
MLASIHDVAARIHTSESRYNSFFRINVAV